MVGDDGRNGASPTVRAFVALELSETLRLALMDVPQSLRRLAGRVNWAAPENWHVTLFFLGDVFEEQVSAMRNALNAAAESLVPFSFEVKGLGWFGPARAPRVIWAGLGAGARLVAECHSSVLASLRPLGFAGEERPFVPHITLGRVRAAGGNLTEALTAWSERFFGTQSAVRLALMRSQLSPRGAVYSSLHTADFRGSPPPDPTTRGVQQ